MSITGHLIYSLHLAFGFTQFFVSCSGDHTVKIIDCETGNCLKVLNGHRRTPWVVSWRLLAPFSQLYSFGICSVACWRGVKLCVFVGVLHRKMNSTTNLNVFLLL